MRTLTEQIPSLIIAITFAMLGAGVYFGSRRERVNRVFALYCLFGFALSFIEFEWLQMSGGPPVALWSTLRSLWPLVPASLLHFTLVFARVWSKRRAVVLGVLVYGPAIAIAVFGIATSIAIGDDSHSKHVWSLLIDYRSLALFSWTWSGAVGLTAVFFAGRNYRAASPGLERTRAGCVALGVLLPMLASLFAYVVLPRLGIILPQLSSIGSLLAAFFVVTAIQRYRLFSLSPSSVAQEIFDSISDLLLLVDPSGVIIQANPAVHRHLGYWPEELEGKSLGEILPADVVADLAAATRPLETQLRMRAGGQLEVSALFSPILGPGGAPKGYVLVARDVSEVLRTERKLRLLERAIETTRSGVTVKDLDGVIIYSNPAEARMHGFGGPDSLIGRRASSLAPLELSGELSVREMAAEGGLIRESVNQRADGSRFPVQLVSDVIAGEDGAPIGIVTVCDDITDRKHIELALEAANEALQQANSEIKKVNAQVIQAEKLNALGELSASVAHDLAQPLNGIQLISQSLLRYQDTTPPDQLRDALEDLVHLAQVMASSIDHLRSFARRSVEAVADSVDIVLVVTKALRLTGGELRNAGVEVRAELGDRLPMVIGDANRLEQAVLNLIMNARDAVVEARRSDPWVKIRVKAQAVKGTEPSLLVVEVADNGVGIPAEALALIFKPFETTKAPGKGTGLGLPIARRIVEEHGGKIEVESEPGRGACFRIILPVAPCADPK